MTDWKDKWERIDWASVEEYILGKQKEIKELAQQEKKKEMYKKQKNLTRNMAAKLWSVKRVMSNTGKNTPGVDKVLLKTPEEKWLMARSLKIHTTADGIRRAWIPKSTPGEYRPLGIPTMRDRCNQMLALLALDPQTEAVLEEEAHGFRPNRSCLTAMRHIEKNIKGPHWMLDADIKKCFDRINHEALLKKLQTYPKMERQIRAWLKAKIHDRRKVTENEQGTPQGGIISPLLANIALSGITSRLKKEVDAEIKAVWYADDFIIFHQEKEKIHRAKEAVQRLLGEIGLELNEEKTSVRKTHPSPDGFEPPGARFLGYWFWGEGETIKWEAPFKKIMELIEKLSYHAEKGEERSFNLLWNGWKAYYTINGCKKYQNPFWWRDHILTVSGRPLKGKW